VSTRTKGALCSPAVALSVLRHLATLVAAERPGEGLELTPFTSTGQPKPVSSMEPCHVATFIGDAGGMAMGGRGSEEQTSLFIMVPNRGHQMAILKAAAGSPPPMRVDAPGGSISIAVDFAHGRTFGSTGFGFGKEEQGAQPKGKRAMATTAAAIALGAEAMGMHVKASEVTNSLFGLAMPPVVLATCRLVADQAPKLVAACSVRPWPWGTLLFCLEPEGSAYG
jgi:hypothetical protein